MKSTFDTANGSIDKALDIVIPRMDAILALQEKAADLNSKIGVLHSELDALIEDERRSALLDSSPPMLSVGYISQFSSGQLWYEAQKSMTRLSWFDSRFFERHGWIFFIHAFTCLFMIMTLHRKRAALSESDRWRFLGSRPCSAGLFIGYMATDFLYEYAGAPGPWKLVNMTIAAISFARLMDGLIEESWKKRFIYGLTVVLIVSRTMDLLSVPLPIFRLFTVLASVVVVVFCLRFARENKRLEGSIFYARLLYLTSLFFGVVIIAELWAKKLFHC